MSRWRRTAAAPGGGQVAQPVESSQPGPPRGRRPCRRPAAGGMAGSRHVAHSGDREEHRVDGVRGGGRDRCRRPARYAGGQRAEHGGGGGGGEVQGARRRHRSADTSRGRIAPRVGELIAKAIDWTATRATRTAGCGSRTPPGPARPSVAAQSTAAIASSTLRRSYASATAPPHSPKTSSGTNAAIPDQADPERASRQRVHLHRHGDRGELDAEHPDAVAQPHPPVRGHEPAAQVDREPARPSPGRPSLSWVTAPVAR